MNRENVLFVVVGLLLGYIAAFHVVVYFNQAEGAAAGARASAGAGAGAGGEELPTNEVKERQRLQTVAEEAGRAARADAQNFDAQAAAARAFLAARDFEGAIDFLTRANQLRPDDFETLVRLGDANSGARRFEDAERWYKAALARQPDNADVRTELAATFYFREPKQPDKAMSVLRETLERDPRHVATLHNLVFLLIESRQFEEAEETLARLERADPSYPQLPGLREELERARSAAPDADADAKKSPAD